MKKLIYLGFVLLFMSCTKNNIELQDVSIKKLTPTDLANAFASISDNNKKSSSSEEIIEQEMLLYLSSVYGSELDELYFENKKKAT